MGEDRANDQVKTVYAHFGLAMYLAQVLEHGLVNTLMFLDLLPSRAGKPVPRKQWEAEFDSFMQRHFETTLGRMIRALQDVAPVPPQLEAVLTEALKKRNFLAHHYFRERAEQFMSYEGREEMISELKHAQTLFEAADAKLTEVCKPVREEYGFTDERLSEFFAEYLKNIKHDL